MPTSVSPAITTNAPIPLSAIRLTARNTDSSGLTDQTSWPLYRRIELTVSAIYRSISGEPGVHRNRGVEQLGDGAAALGCVDGLLKGRLVGVRDLHGRVQVARSDLEPALRLIQ